MYSIFRGDFVRRFISLNGFQCHLRLQFHAVSFALSCHRFSPCGASLDTAILSYLPVQETGTIINFRPPFLSVLKALFSRKMVTPLFVMLVYISLVVFAAYTVRFWDISF